MPPTLSRALIYRCIWLSEATLPFVVGMLWHTNWFYWASFRNICEVSVPILDTIFVIFPTKNCTFLRRTDHFLLFPWNVVVMTCTWPNKGGKTVRPADFPPPPCPEAEPLDTIFDLHSIRPIAQLNIHLLLTYFHGVLVYFEAWYENFVKYLHLIYFDRFHHRSNFLAQG